MRTRERHRTWQWKTQEDAYAQLLQRIEWARQFESRVDLRALATRSDPDQGFELSYVHAHVVPVDDDAPRSFRYPTAWFEREVVSIDEFLRRLDAADIAQTASRRATQRELGTFGVGEFEVPMHTNGDTWASSPAGLSRTSRFASWSWRVPLVSYGPAVPLVSYSGDAPYFESRIEIIEHWGGMRWFRDTDARPRCFNIVVADPRGVILGLEQAETSGPRTLRLAGLRLADLRLQLRWVRDGSPGALSTGADEVIELPKIDGPYELTAALVAEHDELVDVADYEIAAPPSAHDMLELIRRGETALVEFKSWIQLGDDKLRELECCLVAMANGDATGTILIGVDDVGELVWANWMYKKHGKTEQQKVASQIEQRKLVVQRYASQLRDALLRHVSPAPRVEVTVVDLDPDVVLRMDVQPHPEWVHDRNEQIWIRRNASVRAPNNVELRSKLT